jgi:hypothetical protein
MGDGMLKIQTTRQTGNDVTVAIIGTIGREYLGELERVIERASRDRGRLSFDLSQVRLVDREAVGYLASARDRGVRLVGCPAYLREWLRLEAPALDEGRLV